MIPLEVQTIVDELGYSVKAKYSNYALVQHGVLGDLTISYANLTHYRVQGSMPPNAYVKAPDSISISKKKSPKKVADEIRVRYLAHFTPLWRQALKEQQEHDDYVAMVQAKTQKVCETLPIAVVRGQNENIQINVYMSKGENYLTLQPGRGFRIEGYLTEDALLHLLQYLKTKL